MKIKPKLFLIIFFSLAIIQFLTGLSNVFISQSKSDFSAITSILMMVFSLPISLISRDLPFYASGGEYFAIIFWILNLLVQTIIIYGIIKILKKP